MAEARERGKETEGFSMSRAVMTLLKRLSEEKFLANRATFEGVTALLCGLSVAEFNGVTIDKADVHKMSVLIRAARAQYADNNLEYKKKLVRAARIGDRHVHSLYESIEALGGLKPQYRDERSIVSFQYVRGSLGVEVFRDAF